jgi:2-dehydro-3-deoxygluconokinase
VTVTVLGDINVDLELLLPVGRHIEHRNPEPSLSGGGSAANAAAALARLGVPVRFVGVVGNDAFGTAAVESLAGVGVDVGAVRVLPGGETVAVIVVVPPGADRIIYVWPPRGGAHTDLRPDEAVAASAESSWIHVSGIALRGNPAGEALIQAMSVARAGGTPVSLDLNLRLENWGWESGFRSVVDRAVDASSIVLGGAIDEFRALTGSSDPTEAVRMLAGNGRTVIARLGADGAIASDGSRVVASPGHEVVVVDTLGAGDSFDAGFIDATLRGLDLERSLAYANAVAAITVGRHGARDTPTRAEVEAFLESRDDTAD